MGQHRIETSIDIDAPPAQVWQVLTDPQSMPAWNPFIVSMNGELKPGARITIRLAPPGRPAMRFRPTVLTVKPERELRWFGRLLIPRLFDGEHYFRLHKTRDGGTHLVHGEEFSGLLISLARRRGMFEATRAGFEAMNDALKQRVEAQ